MFVLRSNSNAIMKLPAFGFAELIEDVIVELSREEVRQIAELAKLDLTEDEVEVFTKQLSEIIEYFNHLSDVDTSHIPPTASVLPLKNVLREDNPQEPLSPDEVVANAPDSRDAQFQVSAVLGEE